LRLSCKARMRVALVSLLGNFLGSGSFNPFATRPFFLVVDYYKNIYIEYNFTGEH